MSRISGTYGSHPDTGMDFHELLTAYYLGAIIVNTHGRRFVNESLSYKTLGTACLGQPKAWASKSSMPQSGTVHTRDVRSNSSSFGSVDGPIVGVQGVD